MTTGCNSCQEKEREKAKALRFFMMPLLGFGKRTDFSNRLAPLTLFTCARRVSHNIVLYNNKKNNSNNNNNTNNKYIYTHHIYTYYRFKEIPMNRHFESKCTTACKQNIFDEIRQVHQFSSTHQVASSCYFRRERREKRSLIPKRIRKKSPFPRPQDCNMETGLLGAFVYLALF